MQFTQQIRKLSAVCAVLLQRFRKYQYTFRALARKKKKKKEGEIEISHLYEATLGRKKSRKLASPLTFGISGHFYAVVFILNCRAVRIITSCSITGPCISVFFKTPRRFLLAQKWMRAGIKVISKIKLKGAPKTRHRTISIRGFFSFLRTCIEFKKKKVRRIGFLLVFYGRILNARFVSITIFLDVHSKWQTYAVYKARDIIKKLKMKIIKKSYTLLKSLWHSKSIIKIN